MHHEQVILGHRPLRQDATNLANIRIRKSSLGTQYVSAKNITKINRWSWYFCLCRSLNPFGAAKVDHPLFTDQASSIIQSCMHYVPQSKIARQARAMQLCLDNEMSKVSQSEW